MINNQKRDRTKDKKKEILVASLIFCGIGFLLFIGSINEFSWGLWISSFIGSSLLFYYFLFNRSEPVWHLLIESFSFFIGLCGISFACYLIVVENLELHYKNMGFLCALVIILFGVLSGVFYLYIYDIPLWRKYENINLKRKINLKNGIFLLAEPWAGTYEVNKNSIIAVVSSMGGVVGIFLAQLGGEIGVIFIGILSFFVNICAGILVAHKLHYLFRLIQLEKKIGKRLILE